ncbi:MAG: hypothetical protein WAT22_01680 [Saprospiraceae bacterium]
MEESKILEYSNIYIKVLEIGESKLSSGIAYCDLLTELKDCIEINNCSTIALKKFFCDNFFHKELHDGKASVTIAEFEGHLCCNFVMSGEAWNKLQQYRHFQNSKTQIDLLQGQIKIAEQNTKEAQKESRFARNLAYGAIAISILTSIPDWKSLFDSTNSDIKNNTTLSLQQETSQTIQLQRTNELFDSLLDQLNNRVAVDKTKKENSPKNDKTLNNNLKSGKK